MGRPSNYSFHQRTRLNDLLYGIKILTGCSSVTSQFTRLTDRQTDGRTDRQTNIRTEFSLLDRVCIQCSAVKCIMRLTTWSQVRRLSKVDCYSPGNTCTVHPLGNAYDSLVDAQG